MLEDPRGQIGRRWDIFTGHTESFHSSGAVVALGVFTDEPRPSDESKNRRDKELIGCGDGSWFSWLGPAVIESLD